MEEENKMWRRRPSCRFSFVREPRIFSMNSAVDLGYEVHVDIMDGTRHWEFYSGDKFWRVIGYGALLLYMPDEIWRKLYDEGLGYGLCWCFGREGIDRRVVATVARLSYRTGAGLKECLKKFPDFVAPEKGDEIPLLSAEEAEDTIRKLKMPSAPKDAQEFFDECGEEVLNDEGYPMWL